MLEPRHPESSVSVPNAILLHLSCIIVPCMEPSFTSVLLESQKTREKEIYHLLVYPTNTNNNNMGQLKPGCWDSIRVFNMGGRDPNA